jgi:hypothetical protein
LWSAGATVDLEDALPPSPLANAFDEPNNLQDDSSQGTVLAAADHQQSQPSTLSYSTLPSNERWTTDNVQRLDLQLPPRSPNVFEQDDFTYLDRLRNGEQLQDALMAGLYTETQHEAAIDDMARRQPGFAYDTPTVGPPQLRPIDVSSRPLYGNAMCAAFQCQPEWNDSLGMWVCWNCGSLYGNAMCAAFQCQPEWNDSLGMWVCWNCRSLYGNGTCAAFQCQPEWNDSLGMWVCWNQSCACRREYVTMQHGDSAYSVDQLQGPAES